MSSERDMDARMAETIRNSSLGTSEIIAAVRAAGYRRPRTITTTEELKGLPNDAVILSDEGGVFQKDFGWWRETGTRDVMTGSDLALPATVLHEGNES